MSEPKKLLLIGASGVIGQAVLKHFQSLPQWDVVTLGRRLPANCSEDKFLAVDLLDREATLAALSARNDITHVVYAAVYEKPGALVEGWRDPEQMERNDRMLRNAVEGLAQGSSPLRHITLFQGSKAYGSHLPEPVPVPAKERWPRHDHANFYWLQEDFIRERQPSSGWTFTILRPRIVFGEALGSNMNPIAAIGAYAAIQRFKGEPLHYPGGPERLTQATDADLIAKACEWAAEAPSAQNRTFNIENGDVFTWHNVWPAICEALDMEPGEPRKLFLDTLLHDAAALWPQVVDAFGLRAPRDLQTFVGQSLSYCDFQMATARDTSPPPIIVSSVAIRQAGFHDCIDTEDMFRKWFGHFRKQGLLP